jgi:hypothetical protein
MKIKKIFSETTEPISTKLYWDDLWVVPFHKYVWHFRPPTKIRITGYIFGRGPSKDHSSKVWFQLALWFLRRRFLCEFPIRSYVKLSSSVGAILVEGPNHRTHFWKRTIQGDEN